MGDIHGNATLYYIHDPMCSWCWGFRPVWIKIQNQLSSNIAIRYVLGGLAVDTDEPMPEEMRTRIRNTWQQIQRDIPGTEFNYDFWETCQPRRSTYPSCRAVLAAQHQNTSAASDMLLAIQQAYYLQARNPSDQDVLISLAEQLKLDKEVFSRDLVSAETQEELLAEFELRRKLKVYSFPSLVLEVNNTYTLLDLDYNNPAIIIQQITELLAENQVSNQNEMQPYA